jgi:predicted DNA-binding transcriptional regulator YafY
VKRLSATRKVGKTERWLNLLAFLCDRRYPVTREQILSEVDDYRDSWRHGDETARESVRRKFERDKSELRELGVVIEPRHKIDAEHTDGEVEAYQLRPRDLYLPYLELASKSATRVQGYHLPSTILKAEEFAVLRRAAERVLALGATPLGPSADSALRKLSFDLPGLAPGGGEVSLTAPVSPTFTEVFSALRQSLESRLPVHCVYYAISRDSEDERVIHPYGLMLSWGIWYCIAFAPERSALRVFRIDRMRSAAIVKGVERFEVPASFRVEQYLDRAPWELSDAPATTVRVRIAFPHARWVMAEGLGSVVEAVDEGGGALLEFQVRQLDSFLRWLLPFGLQAEITDPPEAAARLRAERDRVRALYA